MDLTQTIASSETTVFGDTKTVESVQVGIIKIIPEQPDLLDEPDLDVTYFPKGNGKPPLVNSKRSPGNNPPRPQKNESSLRVPARPRQAPPVSMLGGSHTSKDKGKKA